jgi:hemerythrin-like domain-containing protein
MSHNPYCSNELTMETNRTQTAAMDPIALLTADHRNVQKLFKEFTQTDKNDVRSLSRIAKQAINELKVHTTLEEEVFYPAVRKALDDDDIVSEAEIEHRTAKALIEGLEKTSPDNHYYRAMFTVLSEYVKHHIEEEEKEMFPQARKSGLDMALVAEQLRKRRGELQTESEPAAEIAD